MIRAFLLNVWERQWPGWLRRLVSDGASLPLVHTILFPHFLVGVVGIIHDDQGRILLLHHTYRGTPWGLPTGFLEHGEQPIDALAREIMEEAGLRVVLDPEPLVYTERERPLLNIVYRGRFASGSFEASTEVSQARWFSLDALPPMLPSQRDLLMTDPEEVSH